MARAVPLKKTGASGNHKAAQPKTTRAQVDPPESGERNETTEEALTRVSMQDVLWIVVTIVFFAISIGYVEFCDRMK